MQMTKVNWRLKVNWKNVAQKYRNILLNCSHQKSIVTQNISEL